MLHAFLKNLLTITTISLPAVALCADDWGILPKESSDTSYIPQEAIPLYDDLDDNALTPLQKRGKDLAAEIFNNIQSRPGGLTGQSEDWMKSVAPQERGPAGIANPEYADKRTNILDFLGLDDAESRLYIFVSHSMPMEMLKAYAREAMWTGGMLVFRGIDQDMSLREFALTKLYPLVGKKGASATIHVDPRLYDAYNVTAVPTIVLSTHPEREVCLQTHDDNFSHKGKTLPYKVCTEMQKTDYYKLSGAVTTGYALEQFVEAGSYAAERHLAALERSDISLTQEQKPFTGNWDTMKTPEELRETLSIIKAQGQEAYETPYGIAIGPQGLENKENNIRTFSPLVD